VNLGVTVSAFLAASIEVIEMVAIVVAVGVARSWRSSLAGAAGGLVVLVILVAVLGTALRNVPWLRCGSQWDRCCSCSAFSGWAAPPDPPPGESSHRKTAGRRHETRDG